MIKAADFNELAVGGRKLAALFRIEA